MSYNYNWGTPLPVLGDTNGDEAEQRRSPAAPNYNTVSEDAKDQLRFSGTDHSSPTLRCTALAHGCARRKRTNLYLTATASPCLTQTCRWRTVEILNNGPIWTGCRDSTGLAEDREGRHRKHFPGNQRHLCTTGTTRLYQACFQGPRWSTGSWSMISWQMPIGLHAARTPTSTREH